VLVVYSYQFINRFTTRNKHIIQRYQIYPLFLNLISIAIIAKITDSVLTGTGIRHFDNVVYTFFQKIHSPFLTDFFIVITAIATPTNLIILSCLLVAYFMYQKRWYFLALLPLSLLAGVISNSILKKLVHLSRPFFPLVPTTDFSFPSGHATLAIIFFGLVIYFFKDSIKSMLWRRFFVTLCIFCGLIICFSRLYVNAHWFSDVLAGMALGTFWVTFFIVLFHFFTSLSPKRMTQELEKEIKEEQDMLV
jgi:undecaprenyl-diphosphatase